MVKIKMNKLDGGKKRKNCIDEANKVIHKFICEIIHLNLFANFNVVSIVTEKDGRRSKMIRTTAPGPYEDIVGPTVLAVVLILSIITQFSIKLYTLL